MVVATNYKFIKTKRVFIDHRIIFHFSVFSSSFGPGQDYEKYAALCTKSEIRVIDVVL